MSLLSSSFHSDTQKKLKKITKKLLKEQFEEESKDMHFVAGVEAVINDKDTLMAFPIDQ